MKCWNCLPFGLSMRIINNYEQIYHKYYFKNEKQNISEL